MSSPVRNYFEQASFSSSNAGEWQFLFEHGIDWKTLIPLYYPKFPTEEGIQTPEEMLRSFRELITATGEWCAQSLYPRARELDEVGGGTLENDGVKLSEPLLATYREAAQFGVFGVCASPKYGGMGAPIAMGLLIFEQLSRAGSAYSTQFGFFSSIADMLERFADEATCERLIPSILKGELSGSMCITEPHAGSDVGALRTRATPLDDGTYLLNGAKIFITNGGGGMGLVLARIEGEPGGLEGISLFLVEEFVEGRRNYRISKIEHKMGMHGSPTCEVVYENTRARLVGKPNEGFKSMLHLMNEARICVGLQGLGGIEAALDQVEKYAEERAQFGKRLHELPLFRRNLTDWQTERDAFRALMVDTVSWFDIYTRLDLRKRQSGELNAEQTALFQKAKTIVRRRTPLVKYYGAEAYAELSQRAIQAFGGYGFMREYDAERIHRDSFGSLLYEGTSQIQALMAMKDLVKAMTKNPGKFLQSMVMTHPLSGMVSETNPYRRDFRGRQYEFRKNVGALMLRCFRPELGLAETMLQLHKLLSASYWQDQVKVEKLMVHAETICQAMAYLETLSILSKHAAQNPARAGLYDRYVKLVQPRFAAIYADWS